MTTKSSFWHLGLGLWWAWFPVFGLRIYLAPSLLEQYGVFFDFIWAVGISFLALSLALLIVCKKFLTPLCTHPVSLIASACSMSVGVLVLGASGQAVIPAEFALLGTVIATLGAAPLMMSWGELLSVVGERNATLSIAGSILLAGILFALLTFGGSVSPWLAIAVPVLCPLLSLLAIFKSWQGAEVLKQRAISLSTQDIHVPLKTGIGSIVYGIAIGLMLAYGTSVIGAQTQLSQLAFCLGTIVSSIPLLFLLYFFAQSVQFNTLYRLALPVVACVLLILISLGSRIDGAVIAFVVALGWGYKLMLAMMASATMSNRFTISGLMIFTKMSAPHNLGEALGILIWFLGLHSGQISSADLPALASAVVVALILASVFLLTDPTKEVWGIPQQEDAPIADVGFNQKIELVAHQFGLTQREEEVLSLLAKGRNADYVQHELVISVHTARTHIKRIHSKLQIHNQQELLDLLDAKELSEYERPI